MLIILAAVAPALAIVFWLVNQEFKSADENLRRDIEIRAKIGRKPRRKKSAPKTK